MYKRKYPLAVAACQSIPREYSGLSPEWGNGVVVGDLHLGSGCQHWGRIDVRDMWKLVGGHNGLSFGLTALDGELIM